MSTPGRRFGGPQEGAGRHPLDEGGTREIKISMGVGLLGRLDAALGERPRAEVVREAIEGWLARPELSADAVVYGWRWKEDVDAYILQRGLPTLARVLLQEDLWHGDLNAAVIGEGLGFRRIVSGLDFHEVLGVTTEAIRAIESGA